MPVRPLNLFYEEPDPDRWVPLDRYPRRWLRRVLRGAPRPGGQMRVFLNLRAGLDRLGVSYRLNDYAHARRHPEELACVLGKPHVLDHVRWRNPILFGAAVFSHPVDDPRLFERLPVVRVLVPGGWIRDMWVPHYGASRVTAWPVGIDTVRWSPTPDVAKDVDVLVYDKVRWDHDRYERELIAPLAEQLAVRGLRTMTLRYGSYDEEEFQAALARSRAMLFLCEHETQGIAYQQALASGVPILAWDRGGAWQDPAYYPDRVCFAPVSSVPYWDGRCGVRFAGEPEFGEALDAFVSGLRGGRFDPRSYILENLTLEHCAGRYVELARAAEREGAWIGEREA